MTRYALVYQAGLANVFCLTEDSITRRVLQHAFGPCEWYARGLIEAGQTVEIWSCNQAGDIVDSVWTKGRSDCPFRANTAPPVEALYINA